MIHSTNPNRSQSAIERRNPIVTVDVVLLTIAQGRLCLGLLPRRKDPFAGALALVGGYVHPQEDADIDATAARVLREKTGLEGIFLEQLRTFAGPDRDPRGWSVSVAYFALVPVERLVDGARVPLDLRDVENPGPLPFDHERIVAEALRRVRGKGAYSTLPARLLPEEFTLAELQQTYEIVLDDVLDKSAFRRKINDLGLVEEIPGATRKVRRPAQLYRLRRDMQVFDRRI